MGRRGNPGGEILTVLEANALAVVSGKSWLAQLDKSSRENLQAGRHRKYNGKSVQDLLRALRNMVSRSSGPLICR